MFQIFSDFLNTVSKIFLQIWNSKNNIIVLIKIKYTYFENTVFLPFSVTVTVSEFSFYFQFSNS